MGTDFRAHEAVAAAMDKLGMAGDGDSSPVEASEQAAVAEESPQGGESGSPTVDVGAPAADGGAPAALGERQRDGQGRFLPKDGESKEARAPRLQTKAPAKASPPPAAPAVQGPTPGAPAAPQVDAVKPPAGWKGDAQAWAGLPPQAQEAVQNVFKDAARYVQEHGEAKKNWQQMKEMAAPYEHIIRSEGGSLQEAFGQYLQTAAAIRMAPPDAKADRFLELAEQHLGGLEAAVDYLNRAITKREAQGPAPAGPAFHPGMVEQMVEQKLAAAREAAIAKRIQQEFADFEATQPEFWDELREPTIRLMQNGMAKTWAEAREMAALLNPKIRGVYTQRQAAAEAATAQAATQRQQMAAATPKPQPAAQVNGAKPKGWHGAVEEAFAKHGR